MMKTNRTGFWFGKNVLVTGINGFIGGNLANASPVGDLAPALIAMGAVLELVKAGEARALPLQDFFKAYGQHSKHFL